MIAIPHPVVLVTGVSSGIGRATAPLLAANGYRVYGSVRRIKREAESAGVALVRFDVRDGNSIQTARQRTVACIGDALKCHGGGLRKFQCEAVGAEVAPELLAEQHLDVRLIVARR